MPTNARKKHWIGTGGPWGTGLLILGLMAFTLGLGYFISPADAASGALRNLTPPLKVWAVGWMAAGVFAAVKALRPPQRHTDVWPVVGMSAFWAAALGLYWLYNGIALGVWDRSWAGSVIFGAFAALIISWARCVNPPSQQ